MAIHSVIINVSDIETSLAFYTKFLDFKVLERTAESAVLDAVAANIVLRKIDRPAPSSWLGNDLQKGFRHIGLKVSDLDARVESLRAAGVDFSLDPIDASGKVRITFFYDPDGTHIELVEGPLHYEKIFDEATSTADWEMPTPGRPRFDHVAETVASAEVAHTFYGDRGYVLMAGISLDDPRGFEITFLRDGDTSLEIFEFTAAETVDRAPQVDALGFFAVQFDHAAPGNAVIGSPPEYNLWVDPDGLVATSLKP